MVCLYVCLCATLHGRVIVSLRCLCFPSFHFEGVAFSVFACVSVPPSACLHNSSLCSLAGLVVCRHLFGAFLCAFLCYLRRCFLGWLLLLAASPFCYRVGCISACCLACLSVCLPDCVLICLSYLVCLCLSVRLTLRLSLSLPFLHVLPTASWWSL